MNCKPGDLALVVSASAKWNGMLVEVLYAQPSQDFTLPDGYPASVDMSEPAWVIKFLGGKVVAPIRNRYTGHQSIRMTLYGVGADSKLRPLPGIPDEEYVEERSPVTVDAQ